MPFFDKTRRVQVLPGVHFSLGDIPADVVELPADNIAFMTLPKWHALEYDADGLPSGSTSLEDPIAEKIAAIRSRFAQHIDAAAHSAGEFGFDNIISAVSYADDVLDTVNQPHAAALLIFRRECWASARELLAAWKSSGIEPTEAEIIAALPTYGGIV